MLSSPSSDSTAVDDGSRPEPLPLRTRGSWPDFLFANICRFAAIFVVVIAVLIVGVLVWRSLLSIQTSHFLFFSQTEWNPEPTKRSFGALAFIYGTLATSFIAMLLAVPLGVGTAIYLSEIAPIWLRKPGTFFVEMLAAVPSVVYGFWGLFVLAPMMQSLFTAVGGPNQGGVGILSSAVILAIMIVPYIASVSYDVCRAVPRSQREASYALGATRWQTIRRVLLPYARPGIIGAGFLALGRALGETMAVTMLIGNKATISMSPFALGNSIASVIANEFTEATYDLYLSALVELGLVLLLVSAVVNSLARLLIWKVNNPGKSITFFGRWYGDWRNRVAARKTRASSNTEAEVAPSFGPYEFGANRRAYLINRGMSAVLALCLFVTVGSLFLILGYLVARGITAINWEFFVSLPKPVGQSGGGMANAIVGSLMMVGMATLFAVPIGVCAAIYLSEYRSERLGPTVRFVGELLAGVPSIVIGIFAYYFVVKPMGNFSGWAGAFALGVMMIPIVMRAAEESLRIVPASVRHASFALGASHYQTIRRIVVPAALPAIITGVFLGIARVAGETAPLLLTASSNTYWPRSPNDFTPSLPVYIFNYSISPYKDWHRQAWAAALLLLSFVMLLNVLVRVVSGRRIVAAASSE